MLRRLIPTLATAAGPLAAVLLAPASAQAYIGPGAGLSAIGTVVALLGAILLAVLGFVWYPLKRLRDRHRAAVEKRAGGAGTPS